MINILESSFSSNSDFLHSVGEITSILSLVSLVIFVSLAIKSKSIKSFQSQISVFIAVYVVGEILESNNGIAIFSKLPPDIGSQLHVIAAIFFTIMLWFRFYYAESKGKKMIENQDNENNNNNNNI
jgi:SNF family Na+-dependent transporter